MPQGRRDDGGAGAGVVAMQHKRLGCIIIAVLAAEAKQAQGVRWAGRPRLPERGRGRVLLCYDCDRGRAWAASSLSKRPAGTWTVRHARGTASRLAGRTFGCGGKEAMRKRGSGVEWLSNAAKLFFPSSPRSSPRTALLHRPVRHPSPAIHRSSAGLFAAATAPSIYAQ